MKIFFLVLIYLSLNVSGFSQDNPGNQSKLNGKEAIYYQDFVNMASDKPGLSRVDIYIQVPYKNVQFIKSSKGFTAKYSITASVFDSSKKKLVVEKTWNETINVIDYTMASSKENYSLSKRSFDLAPGVYSVRTLLQDKDSKQEAIGENIFTVKSYDQNISLSDILLISKTENSQGKNEIIPNVSRNFPSSKNRVKYYFEVYLKDSVDTRRTFEYTVLNSEKNIIHKEVEDRNLKPGNNQVLYTLQEFPFDLGVYTLVVLVADSNGT